MGYSTSFRSRRRIFLPCTLGIRRYPLRTRDRDLLPASGENSVSFIGNSDKKKDSLLLTMKLHIQYLRSLEDSERVRKACLAYIQTWCCNFYPERPDLMQEARQLADNLGGRLEIPRLSWKYLWIQKLFGFAVAKRASQRWNHYKSSVMRSWDKALFRLEGRNMAVTPGSFGRTPRFELPKNFRCNGVEPSDHVVATNAEFLLTVTSARVVL